MVISLWRAVARASNRFATFAQAISNTRPTAPSRIHSAGFTSLTTQSSSGTAVMLAPLAVKMSVANIRI